MKKIILLSFVLIAPIFLSGCTIDLSDKTEEKIQKQNTEITSLKNRVGEADKKYNEISAKNKIVELFYNRATGELYPILGEDSPHTCVWTIWGDHGSEFTIVTENRHLISNETDRRIKTNNIFPANFNSPRVEIIINCVNWDDTTLQGKIAPY